MYYMTRLCARMLSNVRAVTTNTANSTCHSWPEHLPCTRPTAGHRLSHTCPPWCGMRVFSNPGTLTLTPNPLA